MNLRYSLDICICAVCECFCRPQHVVLTDWFYIENDRHNLPWRAWCASCELIKVFDHQSQWNQHTARNQNQLSMSLPLFLTHAPTRSSFMYRNSFQWKFECITHHHCEWIKKKPKRSEAKLKSKSTTKRWQQINRISNALTWIWHWFISQMVFSLLFHGIFRTSCSYKCPTHLKNVRGNGKSGWVNVDSHETNRNRKKNILAYTQ